MRFRLICLLLVSVSSAFADWRETAKAIDAQLDLHKTELGEFEVTSDILRERVRLTGWVTSYASRERIAELVREVPAVGSIDNQIEIKEPRPKAPKKIVSQEIVIAAPTDQILRENLTRALKEDGLSSVNFTITDGVVIFRGDANSHQEVDQILTTAGMVDGVKSAESRMTIKGRDYSNSVERTVPYQR